MDFFEDWVELDLNPVISFSSNAKIIYSNSEAQFLLNRISAKELFEIALNYASKTYGTNTSYINLTLDNYIFYAITIKYDNDDEIHMKLYKSAMVKSEPKINLQNIDNVNIFTLVDLAISTHTIKEDIIFIKNYDPSIPEFKANTSSIMKALSTIFNTLKNSKNITCSILLKTGEYIKINDKKYTIVSINICSDEKEDYSVINKLISQDSSLILSCAKNKVSLDIPLINK